jgi:type 1 glutamine amidotransferase
MHQGDELYARLRGPGKNMTVLATAHSDSANNGSGHDEPMLLVVSYGKGRIFHTTLGHDINAMSCVGFVTTLQRGAEWAATGAVTQKVPATFPTADTVSYRADLAAMDPNFKKGLNPLDAAK